MILRERTQKHDDIQRGIPEGLPLSTCIYDKHFGDFIKVLEFLNSFSELLSIPQKFPHGVSMQTLERALVLKEVNGPLSDIFQLLLNAIFSLQAEEESVYKIKYRDGKENVPNHPKSKLMQKASCVQSWVQTHYLMKINRLIPDSTTLSEIIRVHLLGSGALLTERSAKKRSNARGEFCSFDDPGLDFVSQHPHIVKSLNQCSVFQLSTRDVLSILGCLIDQILTYVSLRDDIENRRMRKASFSYRHNYLGSDHAFRNYYVFKSLPGLFVERDVESGERPLWTFYHTREKIDALIESLNSLEHCEKSLRNQLKMNRNAIVECIDKCPLEKLTMREESDIVQEVIKNARLSNEKQYMNPEFNYRSGSEINAFYEFKLRETLLQFERDIRSSGRGLKVIIQNPAYWLESTKTASSKSGEQNDSDAKSDLAQTEDSGNCSGIMDDSGPTQLDPSEMDAVKTKVQNLALALAEIAKGINENYIRHDKIKPLKKRLRNWGKSLQNSTSFSQVFLHYNILYDSINWPSTHICCLACRSKSDPERILLCDQCNRGWHMYCLHPKLTEIPGDDWFCPRCCRPTD